jgi:hypothetical protein
MVENTQPKRKLNVEQVDDFESRGGVKGVGSVGLVKSKGTGLVGGISHGRSVQVGRL